MTASQDWNWCLYQHQPHIVEPRNSGKQAPGKIHVQCSVKIIAAVPHAIMMEPMQDRAEVARGENHRIHQNKSNEQHEEESFVAESRWLYRKSILARKTPGKSVQAKKVKNVLRAQSQTKADGTQVVPSPCTLARICLLGASNRSNRPAE